MGAERVAVRDLDPAHRAPVAGEERFELGRVQVGVRAVGDDERLGRAEMVEQPVESGPDGPLGAERRVALAQLARARLPHDLLAPPVRGQALEEVVALDVTGVVAGRGVGRVEVGDRRTGRLQREDVGAARARRARDDGGVAALDRLPEQLAQAHPELPAAVVVARRRDREDAARLLLGGRQAQRAERERPLGAAQLVDVRPRAVQEGVVGGGEVEPVERARDEVAPVAAGRADRVHLGGREALGPVRDERLGQRRRERQMVVREHLPPGGLERVGDDSTPAEGVDRRAGWKRREDLGKPRSEPMLRAHESDSRIGHVQRVGRVAPTFRHCNWLVSFPRATVSFCTRPIWFARRTRISTTAPRLR